MLVCLIRTTEHNATNDGPSYDLLVTQLFASEFEQLEAEMALRNASRMTVTRLADLVMAHEEWPHRGHGRNLLAFQCGNWLYVQQRGMLFGAETPDKLIEDVRTRLNPSVLLQAETRFIATGVPGAQRTLKWIDAVKEWKAGRRSLPIEEWAHHVRLLADDVATHDLSTIETSAGSELLVRLLGSSELAASLIASGIRGAADAQHSVRSTVALVHQTAFSPAQHPTNMEPQYVSTHPLFEKGQHGWDVIAARSQ
jgi:hypothetical protein